MILIAIPLGSLIGLFYGLYFMSKIPVGWLWFFWQNLEVITFAFIVALIVEVVYQIRRNSNRGLSEVMHG